MALLRMAQNLTLVSAASRPGSRSTIWLVRVVAGLLILTLISAALFVLFRLREDAFRGTEKHLSAIALTLAEQADRSIQGMDLLLDGIAHLGLEQGVTDAATFDRLLSTREVSIMLRERMIGLPQVSALILYGLDGRVKNTTRSWPVPPTVNISNTDYFRSIIDDPAADAEITAPFQYRTDGIWTAFLLRKVRGSDGSAIGLAAAAIQLHYFEEFYRSVSVGGEGAIALLRNDGMLLARHPPAYPTGRTNNTPVRILGDAMAGTTTEVSPVDGVMRVKAARRLKTYPLVVLVSIPQAAVLSEWWNMVGVLGLGAGVSCVAIIFAATAMGRRWQHREALSQERESRAFAEAALMRERERNAEDESRAKSGFLAMMSHEIRTPMNGVLGLTGTLLDTSLTAEQRRTVEAIRDSGDSLLRILNDILDFSKLDSGKMELEETPFSPATLTQNPVSLLGPRASAKGLKLTAVCAEDLPDAVLGDAGRIRQVLINLVSNAVKFTERGSIAIQAACAERNEQSATLVWTVADTGIGIPSDQQGRLFARFSQADASITRRFGGSGLGLAISKALIEQMGGTITAESQPGRGSTFTIRLSLPITTRIQEAAQTPVDVVGVFTARLLRLGRTARILFAEDNPTNQFVALQLLRGFDVQVDVVADGLEAVHAVSSFAYDVICMDMRMPEMDGLAATRAIRAMGGRLAKVPIVALTANAFPEDVAACFGAGMTGFVAKPINKETLLTALLTALDTATPRAAEVVPTAPPDQPAALDGAAFKHLAEEIGDDGMAELVTVFENETLTRLALISGAGLDHATLIREIHSLKGAAASVCAHLLSGQAAAIEVRLLHGDALDDADVARLTAAFEAWRGMVRAPDRAIAMSA
jgi:signal transduction histidine kinase/CheY-like chemotaxis protein/HPt (histidine-containing phosphotransfer) domain-containing protein